MDNVKELAIDTMNELHRTIPYDDYCTVMDGLQDIETLRDRDEELGEMWASFADVPMNSETECIEEKFMGWEPGTNREEIWHWFDERHSKGVAYLLYGDGVDRTPEMAQLCYQKQLCKECDAEHCAFNPEGVCLFPMVGGRSPDLNDNGCNDFCYKEDEQ